MVRTLAAAAVLLTAACGSTVTTTSQQQVGTTGGLSAGNRTTAPVTSSDAGATSGTIAVPGSTGPGADLPGGSTSVGGTAVATDAPTVHGPVTHTSSYRTGVPGVSQGIDAKTIKLGLVILKGGQAFAQGLGFSLSFGDTRTEFDAIINDLNKRGGINGRRIVPVYAYEDLTSPTNPQGTLCSSFTQDDHVFAVLMPFNPLPEFAACTTKAHTLLINDSTLQPDNSIDKNFKDWLFAPSMMSYSRYPASLVHELAAHHWFDSGGKKVGIVALDNPEFTTPANKVIVPLLKALGLSADVVAVDASNYESQIQTAILKYQGEGISRVMFVQSGAGVPLFFMQDADKQGYKPKYALTSYESPQWFLAGQAPKAQVANSVGIGWQPFMDVSTASYPSTKQEQRCFALQKAAGENNANRVSDITATSTCDLVWSFESAARAAGPDLTSAGWRAGYAARGTSYQSVSTLSVDWSTGRNDGAGSYRWLAWSTSCACFTYAGPLSKDLPE